MIANVVIGLTIGFIIERIIAVKRELTDLRIRLLSMQREQEQRDKMLILAFTDMSKRTYYKRRQLIAQRMNTTAAQLDAG